MSTATATKSSGKTKVAQTVDMEIASIAVQAASLGIAIAEGQPLKSKPGSRSKYKSRAQFIAAHPGMSFRLAAFNKKGTAQTLKYLVNRNEKTWENANVTFNASLGEPTAEEVADNPDLSETPFAVYVVATEK